MARQTEMPEMNMELVDIPGTSLKASPIALCTWSNQGQPCLRSGRACAAHPRPAPCPRSPPSGRSHRPAADGCGAEPMKRRRSVPFMRLSIAASR
jgi:hypothetical protein